MRFLKIQLLLAILLVNFGILYAQNITPVDTSGVWYTNKQDIKCLICLVNEPKKDSIIIEQTRFINFQDSTIIELSDLNAKQKRKTKRNTKLIAGGSGILGIFFGWFACSLIK
jgi:hypothetical protein